MYELPSKGWGYRHDVRFRAEEDSTEEQKLWYELKRHGHTPSIVVSARCLPVAYAIANPSLVSLTNLVQQYENFYQKAVARPATNPT